MILSSTEKTSRAGFTLIEVVTSLMIMSVLMIGLSGAVMVGAHAIPTATAVGLADQQVIDVLNQFRSDFREASSVATRNVASKQSITLEFKANGAHGTPGRVRYLYNSNTGVLIRQIDDHSELIVLDDIVTFETSFTKDENSVQIVNLFMSIEGTIQRRYEMHAALPAKPEER